MTIHRMTAGALAALVLASVTSCSAPSPAEPPAAAPPASAAEAPADSAGAGDAPSAALGQAASAVAGLAALGGLGQGQGAGEQVRGLGGQMVTDAQALAGRLGEQAATPTAEQQAMLADLGARTGQPFDQAWLRAATDAVAQARDAANAVLASADATPEARAAAEDTLTRLDALAAGLSASTTAAGADTPRSVDAGTGGQAAADAAPLVALGLLGLGGALVGGAAWRRRRTS